MLFVRAVPIPKCTWCLGRTEKFALLLSGVSNAIKWKHSYGQVQLHDFGKQWKENGVFSYGPLKVSYINERNVAHVNLVESVSAFVLSVR